MYGTKGASTWADAHSNSSNSTIKGVIDSWYNTTTNLSELSTKLSHTAGFCGDRSSNTSNSAAPAQIGGTGTTGTYYGAYYRNYEIKTPSFKCTYKGNDLYTTPEDASQGNKKLTYPIGLITADEVAFAGGAHWTVNTSYYLYTNEYYWTMSPYTFGIGGNAFMFYVDPSGKLDYSMGDVNLAWGVRPVINLKADTTVAEGENGTIDHPYIPT